MNKVHNFESLVFTPNNLCSLGRVRSSRLKVLCRKGIFRHFSQNSQENTCARVSILIKLQASCNFIKKETLAQVFSCEFCESSKNTTFYRTPPVAAFQEYQYFHHIETCQLVYSANQLNDFCVMEKLVLSGIEQHPEAHSEPCETSNKELFPKMKVVTYFGKPFILDG